MDTLFNWTSIGFLLLNFGCQSNPTRFVCAMPRSETDGNPYVCDLYIQGRSYVVGVLGAGVPTKF